MILFQTVWGDVLITNHPEVPSATGIICSAVKDLTANRIFLMSGSLMDQFFPLPIIETGFWEPLKIQPGFLEVLFYAQSKRRVPIIE
jgi:hypothetical protein